MKKSLYIFILILLSCNVFAQNKKELENLRAQSKKAKQDIELTAKLIKETETNKNATLHKLTLLHQQIKLREEYVTALRAEMRELQKNISVAEAQIRTLESELHVMQEEYKLTLFTLYKLNSSYDQLIFVLSAEDFNQAFNRLQYLQYYSDYMIKQAEKIEHFKDSLNVRITNQKKLLTQKNNLLKAEEHEKIELSKDKNKQSSTLQDLQTQEKDLQDKLKKKKAQAKKLDDKIEEIIRAAAVAAPKPTPTDNIISKNFAENKGRLPWPTDNGRITERFGTHRHPTLPIDVECNGIEITTTKGTKARAVFEGTVTKIVVIPGRNTAVLIKHGSYFTVYDNLINISVKPGQKVSVKQEIGTIYTDPVSGVTVLQLQIWQQLQKLDPEPWLSKK